MTPGSGKTRLVTEGGVSPADLTEHMRDQNGVCVRCHRCSDDGCCVQTIHCAGWKATDG